MLTGEDLEENLECSITMNTAKRNNSSNISANCEDSIEGKHKETIEAHEEDKVDQLVSMKGDERWKHLK